MGNYRFKLSDMIPNAWFYKLRDMGKGRKQATTFSRKKKQPPSSTTTTTTTTHSPKPKQPHQQCTPRKSYYFTRDLNQNSNKIHHTSPSNNTRIITPDTNNSPPQEQPRKSSSKQRARRRRTPRISSPRLLTSSVSAGCSCRTTLESVWTKSESPPEYSSSSPLDSSGDSDFAEPEFRTDHVLPTESSSFDEMVSLSTTTNNTNNTDIVIDVDKNSLARKDDKLEGYHEYDSFSELELPPIITKPSKPRTTRMAAAAAATTTTTTTTTHEETNMKGSLKVKIVKEDTAASMKEKTHQQRNNTSTVRGFSVSSPGVKLRINSPRLIGGRKIQSHGRKSVSSAASSGSRRSLSDSFAVVKSSFNPQKDFRESMVEMIVENNIRASKDLEDLLACYLSLNSDEYHELIIKVFKQIWFDLTETR